MAGLRESSYIACVCTMCVYSLHWWYSRSLAHALARLRERWEGHLDQQRAFEEVFRQRQASAEAQQASAFDAARFKVAPDARVGLERVDDLNVHADDEH